MRNIRNLLHLQICNTGFRKHSLNEFLCWRAILLAPWSPLGEPNSLVLWKWLYPKLLVSEQSFSQELNLDSFSDISLSLIHTHLSFRLLRAVETCLKRACISFHLKEHNVNLCKNVCKRNVVDISTIRMNECLFKWDKKKGVVACGQAILSEEWK